MAWILTAHARRSATCLRTAVVGMPAAYAQTPPDLEDLVGARGAGGETQMEARGYQQVRATKVRDQSWTFWWSDVQKACVAIATTEGRFAAINQIPIQNCRPGGVAGDVKPRPQPTDELTLICYGQGEHAVVSSHSGYEWNDKSKRYQPTQRIESASEQFQTGVQFEFRNGGGRVHLTEKLIPPLHSGGSDGWWPLEDIQMTGDRITARYRVSGLNRPTVDIDRRTGMAEIKGRPGFTGKCDSGDWSSSRRF